MAKYDYKCPDGHVSEEVYPMGEAPKSVECRDCGKTATRVFSFSEVLVPPRFHYDKAGRHEVLGD